MTDVLTPAQAEQRDLQQTKAITVREDQFAMAPAGMYPGAGEWAALKEMARALCITEFVPKDLRGRPYAVLAALLTGRDLGVPATAALKQIPIINGRPSLMTAVKVALVRQKGHKVRVLEWDNEHCKVSGWRKGDDPDELMEVSYTIDDAKIAGDFDKGDTYQKRPRQMLYARAAGLLCDTYFSDVTLGLPDPDEAAALPPEVIEGRYVEADRRGELPTMPMDMPLTREEHEAVEKERLERAAASMPASDSPPPPPPRRRGRGPGPAPNPQQGADSSGGLTVLPGGAPAGSPATAATPGPATARAEAEPVTPAEMARGMGLDDIAERLERGEHVPDSGQEVRQRALASARAAETAATAPEPAQAAAAAPEPEQTSGAAAAAAQDPFDDIDGENAVVQADELGQLRQRAETYADFLMRKKLEKTGKSAGSLQELRDGALVALEAIAQQMFRHGYEKVTLAELEGKLLPWLRQRYAAEGGKE